MKHLKLSGKAEESDGGATAIITSGSFNLPFIKN
jgi:hypothetical protein